MMNLIKGMEGTVLVDSPGNLTQQGLIPIFVKSDYIVCPFQYEASIAKPQGGMLLLICAVAK